MAGRLTVHASVYALICLKTASLVVQLVVSTSGDEMLPAPLQDVSI